MQMPTGAPGRATATSPAIRLSGIEKWYRTRDQPVHALSPTDLAIPEGEFVVLLGPSGCGKTTLLRMIGGLIEPSAGMLEVEGMPLWAGGARQGDVLNELGIVFQEPNLFPWLTIEAKAGYFMAAAPRASRSDGVE